jgi:hopene-associated glycosyltransferase HpnB
MIVVLPACLLEVASLKMTAGREANCADQLLKFAVGWQALACVNALRLANIIYPDIGMFTAALIAGVVCVAIWVYLLLAHGRFWRIPLAPRGALSGAASDSGAAESEDPSSGSAPEPGNHPAIAVVIPARNEADVIGRAVGSLLKQSCMGSLHIFVVDDNSTDGTAEAASQAAGSHRERVTVIAGRPLPPGWSGKLWAVQQGVERALAVNPNFLLLTDADVEHSSDNVGLLIGLADSGSYDMASLMVKLHCRSLAERLLIPAFVFFFFLLYPAEWIRDPRRTTAGAAGGCILVRPAALQRIGGIAAIRQEIIDDCALARAVKQSGGKVWLGAAADTHSVRPYDSFAEIERMIARTAFNQLRHSGLLLFGTIVGMLLIYILPLALLASGSARLAMVGTVALVLMYASYLPMVRFYGLNAMWALSLPASAAFYTAATVHSAVKYWRGRGGEWKGRAQDA